MHGQYVVGMTGSGKTTWTRALIREIPSDERLITIEDAKELVLENHPNCVRLFYSKDGQGQARLFGDGEKVQSGEASGRPNEGPQLRPGCFRVASKGGRGGRALSGNRYERTAVQWRNRSARDRAAVASEAEYRDCKRRKAGPSTPITTPYHPWCPKRGW